MSDWPEYVPVLSAADIYKGGSGHAGCHCLLRWSAVVFGSLTATHMAVFAEIKNQIKPYGDYRCATEFNDDPSIRPRKIANVWNRAMESLGYTQQCEIDPEVAPW